MKYLIVDFDNTVLYKGIDFNNVIQNVRILRNMGYLVNMVRGN